MPGLTLLGQVSLETLAAVGQTLQPKVQVVRTWVQNGFHVLGANLSQSEVPFYAEGSTFGIEPTFGSTPTVVGCDGPVGLSAVSLLLSAKRSVFFDRVGPFVTFGDVDIDVSIGDCVKLGGTTTAAEIDNADCGSKDSNYKVVAKVPTSDLCASDVDSYYYETLAGDEQGAVCLDVDWVVGGCMDLGSGMDEDRKSVV